MRLSTLVVLPLLAAAPGVFADAGLNAPGLMPLINKANTLLSSGKFADAARMYSEAIDLSPGDYMLHYRRGTAHMSLQRHSQALADFHKVLNLTTQPPPATHLQIARLHTKGGAYEHARAAARTYSGIAGSEIAKRDAQDVLRRIAEAEAAWKKAEMARKAGLWTACVEAATTALTISSHASEIRGTRAECGIAGGDIELGVSDLTRLTQIAQPSTALFMRIFRISYFFLPHAAGAVSAQSSPLAVVKQCLYFDPDSRPCKAAHKMVKALDRIFVKLDAALAAEQTGTVIAIAGGPDGLLAKLDAAAAEHGGQEQLRFPAFAPPSKMVMPLPEPRKSSPRLAHVLGALCRAHVRVSTGKRLRDSTAYADRLLAMDLTAPHMVSSGVGPAAEVDALVLTGEAAMAREDWETAARFLQDAFEKSGRDRDVYSRMQKAQRLLKQSKQKDYYKVLGVARDADDRTIKKAFRKAAMTAHPDKGGSEEKMAAVNEAYEVLSNSELRARFDNGDDPNDPTSGQQGGPGGGYGFQQGFGGHGFPSGGGFGGGHPFQDFFSGGGGGGQFHFRTG